MNNSQQHHRRHRATPLEVFHGLSAVQTPHDELHPAVVGMASLEPQITLWLQCPFWKQNFDNIVTKFLQQFKQYQKANIVSLLDQHPFLCLANLYHHSRTQSTVKSLTLPIYPFISHQNSKHAAIFQLTYTNHLSLPLTFSLTNPFPSSKQLTTV